jgi:hypothetical protein
MGPTNTTKNPNVMQKQFLKKKKKKHHGLIWHHGLILPLN